MNEAAIKKPTPKQLETCAACPEPLDPFYIIAGRFCSLRCYNRGYRTENRERINKGRREWYAGRRNKK